MAAAGGEEAVIAGMQAHVEAQGSAALEGIADARDAQADTVVAADSLLQKSPSESQRRVKELHDRKMFHSTNPMGSRILARA